MSDEAITSITPRRETTRQRLLDAAAQVFAETGLDAASVEAVCERAGYTRGAFYSNFESKEQLFIELCARTAQAQIAAVRERVKRFDKRDPRDQREDASELVRQVLEIGGGHRQDVLLFGEIRLHALRTPALAAALVEQEEEILASVAHIISDIAAAKSLRLRATAPVAARLLLSTWTISSERAALAGLDEPQTRRFVGGALTEVAGVLLAEEE